MEMKKVMVTVLAAAVVCSMAGCGATGASSAVESAAAETADEAIAEEAALDEEAAELDEDYDLEETDTSKNTINPYIGAYTDENNGEISLYLDAADNTNGVSISVGMNREDGSLEYWEMFGTFDGSRITYTDGVKMIERISEENPDEVENEDIYEDGSGYFEISEDKKVTWTDEKEDSGNGLVFVWDEEMNQQIQEMMSSYMDDGGQNPVMNWVGPYIDTEDKDFSMLVESGAEDTSDCYITVRQETGVDEATNWYIEGTLDTETMTIEYSECRKAECKLDDNGVVVSEDNKYEDGTGRFVIDEMNQSITWIDDKEDAGKGLTFTFSYDYENIGSTDEQAEDIEE